MSNADKIFKNLCTDIIEHGTDTKGEKVRPVWKDTGEPAYTIKKFGHTAIYDLREEFPALTLRKTAIKSAINEILWIFQKKSNNIKDLKPKIWDSWADTNGSIGKAYGYQIGETYCYKKIPVGDSRADSHAEMYNILNECIQYGNKSCRFQQSANHQYMYMMLDQMDAVLYSLRHEPFNRRIITNIFHMDELWEMNLQPCCWSCNFSVTDEGYDKLVLNMVLNQRSNDVLAANNWNVVQYAALLMMVAQASNMIAGKLMHVVTDAHIYDRHVPMVQELISRPEYDAPTVTLNPDIKNFYDFSENDFIIENYKYGDQIKDIPIAV